MEIHSKTIEWSEFFEQLRMDKGEDRGIGYDPEIERLIGLLQKKQAQVIIRNKTKETEEYGRGI